ncbi:MAG: hypothetical protein DWQ37_04320 [Planctomycetota bacterium]|nr:MAG: hypothetical protein DWQ37_04320 [Planctomycetota bacterium]
MEEAFLARWLSATPRRRRAVRYTVYTALGVACVAAAASYLGRATAEQRYEFDIVNLRLRYCEGNIYSERCSKPVDHPTAERLRELGILGPVSEEQARWELTKGFKSGVRGWSGAGRDYVKGLGASTRLTPVPFPAEEDVSKNLWVRWAVASPEDAKEFWRRQQALAHADPWLSGMRVRRAQDYLEWHDANITLDELNTYLREMFPELAEH